MRRSPLVLDGKMKIIEGGRRKLPGGLEQQRKGLLALVHIAKKEIGLDDETYRDMLEGRWGVRSAADMRIGQLEDLVQHFKEMGFRKKKSVVNGPLSVATNRPRTTDYEPRTSQIEVLHGKILERAFVIERGEQRMIGLVKKHCGVDRLEWCRDVGKLKQVLRVMTLLG